MHIFVTSISETFQLSVLDLKVMMELRLVLLPSTHPLGKAALSGRPQLISVQRGLEPLQSRPASHVLNITEITGANMEITTC